MSKKDTKAKYPQTEAIADLLKKQETSQEYRTKEQSSVKNTVIGFCVLLGFFALAALILYVFLAADPSSGNALVLPREFSVITLAVTALYVLLCILILFLSHRVELARFRKQRAESATDASAVRLFKEQIDLPYVVTDDSGKIIVANRAFEEACPERRSSVGEDIRNICSTALDDIIRATAAESEVDQKISEVHAAAVRAYPTSLHKTATADACLELLREIDEISTRHEDAEEPDADSPLVRVHEIASGAFRDAEKRSELWHLCLGTLERILAEHGDTSESSRERLDDIHTLARDAYRLALEKENEILHETALRSFTEALEKIALVSEEDPSAGQLASACRLRLEMFHGKNLLPHLRTLLLNMRQQLAEALPDPSPMSDDRDTVAFQALLKQVETGIEELRKHYESASAEREFCKSTLSEILRTTDTLGANSVSRYLRTIREIAETALYSLLPEKADEYITLVTSELLLATGDKRDASHTDAEAYAIVSELQKEIRNGNREDEERFIASVRDAVRRITEETHLGGDRKYSETDRIRSTVEKEVSGSLSALELLTTGVSTLSTLIKYAEETLTFRDLSKTDQKLVSTVTARLTALKKDLTAKPPHTPSSTQAACIRISAALSALLSKFDEAGDYTLHSASSADERSAPTRMKTLYAAIEKASAATYPLSAEQLAGSFLDRAALTLMGYRLYPSMILKTEEATKEAEVAENAHEGFLREVSERDFALRAWNDSAFLLLLHIGVLRVYAAQNTILGELLQNAEATLEKLTVRRVLTEALSSVPCNSVAESEREGASDEALYRTASTYFREATTHRSRLMLTTCRVLLSRALSFLDSVSRFLPDVADDAERAALSDLIDEASRTRSLLMAHSTSSAHDDPITLAADVFRTCAEKLSAFEKTDSVAGAYHAALSYLSEFFGDLNGRLLRREFFRTYRDTADRIVSALHRAEYTLTALREIRTISETVLSTSDEHGVSFSGTSLKDCCSADLRTIAGLAGTDIHQKLSELADEHAEEALAAKSVWELRKQTLFRIEKRLDFAEDCSTFHDTVLVPRRNEIARLRKLTESHSLLSSTDLPTVHSAEELAAIRSELLAELPALMPDTDLSSLPHDSVAYRFAHALKRTLSACDDPFSAFMDAYKPFYELLNRICTETLSYRRTRKRFQLLRRSIETEKSATFPNKTGVSLSRTSVSEIFSEYLRATLRTVRPVRENNPPMADIARIVTKTMEGIEEDSSQYFRLFAASSLSRLAITIKKDYSKSVLEELLSPLEEVVRGSAKKLNSRDEHPTQEKILELCTSTFKEADAYFRLGDLANSSMQAYARYSTTDPGSVSDCARLYNAVVEARQKIDALRQTVSPESDLYPTLVRLNAASRELHARHPQLDKEKFTGSANNAMTDLLHTVSEIASPYLLLCEYKEAADLRAEIARLRRNVREVADATSTVGSRSTAMAALAAIGQFASTFEDEQTVAAIANEATNEISSIPDGYAASEHIYTAAASALARIEAMTSKEDLRAYASRAHLDLHERRVLYRFLVSIPVERMAAEFHDPTDPGIYPLAERIYRFIEGASERFRAEFASGILRDAAESLRSLTKPDAFHHVRVAADTLKQSVSEFESDLRALPLGVGECFIPPALLAKQKQLYHRFDQLFSLAKRAMEENREDREKARLAENLVLIVYRGIAKFGEASVSTELTALNDLPSLCTSVLNEVSSVLGTLELSQDQLANIRRRVEALTPVLSLPDLLDESVSGEDYRAAFDKLLSRTEKAAEYIQKEVLRFREDSLGDAVPGSLLVYRAGTVANLILNFISDLRTRQRGLAADSLCTTVAGILAQRAELRGKPVDSGMIAVYDRKGRPSGQNNTPPRPKKSKAFVPVKENDEETYRLHGLSVHETSATTKKCVMLGEKRYIAHTYPHRSGGRDYYLVTFTSAEETLLLKQSCEDENTVVALITLDNLEELSQYVRVDYREAEKDVEKALRKWAGEIHGIFHEYERDKYILFFSQKEMASLVNNKFSEILSALESIKLGDSSVSVTISMGISALGNTLTMKEQNAGLALDMALKRGGAQIVIYRDAENQEDRYEFFRGNRVKGLQNENRVGARVVANYLCELIRKSGDVLVMGHAFPDFDSIGSCVGIAALARYYKKDVHIVVNRYAQNFIDCTPDLLTLPEYQRIFIDGTTGMELKGTDTLLVLCDVSNTNIMEHVDIARTSFNTVIIDHHFKTTDSDELKTLLTYIDPSASSASELVSEILAEVLPKDELRKEEANVLLSGIMVDTKSFTRSVGARTFAAALYLREMGANAEISSTYFYEQSGDYKAEVIFRRNLDFHESHREIAITFCTQEDVEGDPELAGCDLRVAASKAADKLLTVRGVHASFALYPYAGGGKEGIAISGRSDGTINVQLILEAFHGGGHFDSAGASLPNKTVDQVKTALSAVIDDYFREEEEKPEDDLLG